MARGRKRHKLEFDSFGFHGYIGFGYTTDCKKIESQ